jgi:ATP-dependent helicase/nuclease subunit B
MILTKVNINSTNTDQLLNDRIKAKQFHKFLLVVPTNRKLRVLKKRIISKAPDQTVTKINIETLGTLTKKLLEVSKQFHELSDEASTIFIEQSVKDVPLIFFNNYAGNIPSGTLSKIKNVISKYKEEGITPERLLEESEQLERSEKKKAIDIANIYKVYLEKCNKLNAYEIGDVYSNLSKLKSDAFQNNFKDLFADVDLIIFDGFDAFTSLELSILNKLSFIKNANLYLNFDYSSYNSIIFSHLEETYNKLQQFGFKKIEDTFEINPDKFIEIVRKRLFLKSKSEVENKFKDRIIKIIAPSRDKEVQAIAKEVKSLLLAGKAEPHEISVTFNLINNYSSIVRDTFESYGIPYNLTDRLKLDTSLSVIAILSFLEILNSDFYYKNIIRAFSNSFVHLDDFDMDALLFSATNLKIVVGRDNWKYSLMHGITFEENLAGLSKSEKRVNKYKKASLSLDIIDDLLFPFKKELTPLNFYRELNKLTHLLNIPQNILASDSSYKEIEIKALTTFLDSAKEIFSLIESENGEAVFNLSFYIETLSTLSSSTRFNIKERSDYGVLVTNINELRGLHFKYSFIGGLIDGDFPTRYRPEIFFSGSFGKKEKHHLNEERFYFYQALSSWDKGLYLTHPKGEEYTTSTFMKDFEKSFAVTEITSTAFENLIYSKEEAERNISLDSEEFPIALQQHEWNEHRNLIEIRTSSPHAYSLYNGFIFNEDESYSDNPNYEERPYSISHLESYTQCPFKYFLERIIKVDINEEPDEEVEAIEIGSLLHSIVYDFYTELTRKNIILQGCSDAVFEIAEKILFDIAEKQVHETFKNSPFAFYEEEKIFGIGGNRKYSILYKFLIRERDDESGRTPKYFETNFGVVDIEQDKTLSQKEPLLLDDIQLRGKIDRIDINKTNNLFEVVDYKTGSKKVSRGEIEEGLSLQLPIYVWAAKTLLLNNVESKYDAEAMSIYSLKYKEDLFGKNPVSLSRKKDVNQTELIDELVDIAIDHVRDSVKNIRKGNFPLTKFIDNSEKVCKFCNYKMICRIDAVNK